MKTRSQRQRTTTHKQHTTTTENAAPAEQQQQHSVLELQRRYGNRAVMRMMASSAGAAGAPPDVQPFFGGIAAGVGNALSGAKDTATGVVGGVTDAVGGAMDTVNDAAGNTARAAFEAALNAAGLPAGEIMDFIDRAGDAAEAIFSDPVGFANNLVAAIKAGIAQFVGNLVGNLKDGAVEWLLTALEGAGLELPDTFSPAGILGMILQVLSITYERLRERVLKRFGRQALRLFEKSASFVKDLLSDPVRLLDLIGDRFMAVLVKVKSLLASVVHKIIKPVLSVIHSMLPTAQTLASAVQVIYKVIQFLKKSLLKLVGLQQAVFENVAAIASGAVDTVTDTISSALAEAVPAVIDFLAHLLGLSGIGDKISDLVKALQEMVSDVMDWIIEAVLGNDDKDNDAPAPTRGDSISDTFSRGNLPFF